MFKFQIWNEYIYGSGRSSQKNGGRAKLDYKILAKKWQHAYMYIMDKSYRTTNKNEINNQRHHAIEPRGATFQVWEPRSWGTGKLESGKCRSVAHRGTTAAVPGHREAEGESMTMGAPPPPMGYANN
jgi:hypothetical protein